jgi:hypothetical protein
MLFDGTIFTIAVAETLRQDREKELAEVKERAQAEAAEFVASIDRGALVEGLGLKNPSTYVKSLMKFHIDDINAVLASRTIARPCVCTLQGLNVTLKEMERRDFHAQVVADATFYLSAKSAAGKTVEDVLRTKGEAAKTRLELKNYAAHVRREQKIEKYTWGCSMEYGKHVTGLGAQHNLAMEREELCIKIPYIYEKMMDMLKEKIKVE